MEVAAHHEAGHALAALKVGRYVTSVTIDKSNPGDGLTEHWAPGRNPYDLANNPVLAWRHTYQTTVDRIFTLLAGPITEAKLVRTPIRHLGSTSDYDKCMDIADRLTYLADFARGYTDAPRIDVDNLLTETRDKVRRWAGRPKTWNMIRSTAAALTTFGQIDGRQLEMVISSALAPDQLHLLDRKPALRGVLQRTTRRRVRHSL